MTMWTKSFVRVALAAGLVLAAAHSPVKSQTILEMSALKCKDYLEATPERQEMLAAWMSGYFNAAQNTPMVDLKRFANNKRLVEKFCRGHKNDNLMSAIRRVAI
jgi:hypothetical protein